MPRNRPKRQEVRSTGSGLYERVAPLFDNKLGPVEIHWLHGSYEGRNTRLTFGGSRGVSIEAVIASLNEELTKRNYQPLRPEDETDIRNINDVLVSITEIAERSVYVGLINYVCLGARLGQVTENKWRSDLSIP